MYKKLAGFLRSFHIRESARGEERIRKTVLPLLAKKNRRDSSRAGARSKAQNDEGGVSERGKHKRQNSGRQKKRRKFAIKIKITPIILDTTIDVEYTIRRKNLSTNFRRGDLNLARENKNARSGFLWKRI